MLPKYSQVQSSFEDLNVRNTTAQLKFNLDNCEMQFFLFGCMLRTEIEVCELLQNLLVHNVEENRLISDQYVIIYLIP